MAPTLLIVDDHATFRDRARRMLEACGYRVVGEAADGASALVAARTLRPEILLLDVQLPDMDGFQVAEALARDVPDSVVVMVSVRDATEYGARLMRSPARGFIPKAKLSPDALAQLLAS